MSQYNKRIVSSIVLSFLMAILIAPSIYAAPAPTGSVTQAESACVLKATITRDEASVLIGTTGLPTSGDISGGTTLGSSANPPSGVPATSYFSTPSYGILCTFGLIKQITNLVWLLVGLLSVAMILYAAFLFMTSQSVPAKIGDARNVLLYAIIGVVVAVSARFLPNLVLSFIGVGGGV